MNLNFQAILCIFELPLQSWHLGLAVFTPPCSSGLNSTRLSWILSWQYFLRWFSHPSSSGLNSTRLSWILSWQYFLKWFSHFFRQAHAFFIFLVIVSRLGFWISCDFFFTSDNLSFSWFSEPILWNYRNFQSLLSLFTKKLFYWCFSCNLSSLANL